MGIMGDRPDAGGGEVIHREEKCVSKVVPYFRQLYILVLTFDNSML